jgi:hypothetical protein
MNSNSCIIENQRLRRYWSLALWGLCGIENAPNWFGVITKCTIDQIIKKIWFLIFLISVSVAFFWAYFQKLEALFFRYFSHGSLTKHVSSLKLKSKKVLEFKRVLGAGLHAKIIFLCSINWTNIYNSRVNRSWEINYDE